MAPLVFHGFRKKLTVGGAKDKIMSLFKTSTENAYSKPTPVKNVHGGRKKPRKPKIQKQSEFNIVNK